MRRKKSAKLEKIKEIIFRLTTGKLKWLTFLVSVIVIALALLNVAFDILPEPVLTVLYAPATIGLFLIVIMIVNLVNYIVAAVNAFAEKNVFLAPIFANYRLRSVLASAAGAVINLAFAVFNLVVTVISLSLWHLTLFVYYAFLVLMRCIALRYVHKSYTETRNGKKTATEKERAMYKLCGILLSVMTFVLAGFCTVLSGGMSDKTYPGYLIYVNALYAFSKIIISCIHMARARKEKSLLLIALRNIGHADALVSILSLQTAMFAAFDNDTSSGLVFAMNTTMSFVVCSTVLALGITMVIKSKKEETFK